MKTRINAVQYTAMSHDIHDQVSLEIARRIARDLPARPDWIELARANLARWRQINASAPGLLRCYDEWDALLRQPVEAVCRVLIESSDDAVRLRHNSPFAGVLLPSEIWNIKTRVRDETIAA
jgi:hypothetical protein